MDDLLALLLFTAPFALLGGAVGYFTRRGRLPVATFVIGLGLTALGLVGLASIGVAIYPLGVILLFLSIGKSIGRKVSSS